MNNPVSILHDEHQLLLDAIRKAALIQETRDNDLYHERVHDIILFFRNFTELYHYPKKDKILYPLLSGRSDEIDSRTIKALNERHQDMEQLLADIVDAHVSYDYAELRATLNKYMDELSAQITHEHNTILAIAPALLTSDEAGELIARFQELDRQHGTRETLTRRVTDLVLP